MWAMYFHENKKDTHKQGNMRIYTQKKRTRGKKPLAVRIDKNRNKSMVRGGLKNITEISKMKTQHFIYIWKKGGERGLHRQQNNKVDGRKRRWRCEAHAHTPHTVTHAQWERVGREVAGLTDSDFYIWKHWLFWAGAWCGGGNIHRHTRTGIHALTHVRTGWKCS